MLHNRFSEWTCFVIIHEKKISFIIYSIINVNQNGSVQLGEKAADYNLNHILHT